MQPGFNPMRGPVTMRSMLMLEVASELSLSVKTIEAHKLNLMRKLDIHNRAHLVEYAIQTGVITAAVTR